MLAMEGGMLGLRAIIEHGRHQEVVPFLGHSVGEQLRVLMCSTDLGKISSLPRLPGYFFRASILLYLCETCVLFFSCSAQERRN